MFYESGLGKGKHVSHHRQCNLSASLSLKKLNVSNKSTGRGGRSSAIKLSWDAILNDFIVTLPTCNFNAWKKNFSLHTPWDNLLGKNILLLLDGHAKRLCVCRVTLLPCKWVGSGCAFGDSGHKELWKPSGPGLCILRTYVLVNTRPQTWISLVALVPLREIPCVARTVPCRTSSKCQEKGTLVTCRVIKAAMLVADAAWHFVVQTVWVAAVWPRELGPRKASIPVGSAVAFTLRPISGSWMAFTFAHYDLRWHWAVSGDKVLICIENWGVDRE